MGWKPRAESVPVDSPIQMPQAIWKYCYARGFDSEASLQNLFQPKLKNLSHPFSLHGMDKAVARLIQAFKSGETVAVYADYDLDGTPGLALLLDGLKQLGFQKLLSYQPSRIKEGYGVHKEAVQVLRDKGASLIVTVDVGITDVEAIDFANSIGVDVIVTDHHLPSDKKPKAVAVVNPNKGDCTSNLQHLCGAGVAFYLVLALKMEMEKQSILKTEINLKSLLDLFAIATITDMVPIIGENRVLVKHGLMQLRETTRPGLKELLKNLGLSHRAITSQDIAFRIAPKLNALTRLDEEIRAFDVLTADADNAKRLVEEMLNVNQRRQQYQQKANQAVQQLLQSQSAEKFVFVCSPEIHPGVVSLIASDLTSKYNVPAFVGSVFDDGTVVGSARAPNESYNLKDVLGAVSSELIRFGGHQVAAGFEFEHSRMAKITELLEESLAQSQIQESIQYYDSELAPEELNLTLMKWIDSLGPFGTQFEQPRFLLKNMKVNKVIKLKGNFIKYELKRDGVFVEAPHFKGGKEFSMGDIVDTLIEPQVNEFRGQVSVQAVIQAMKPAQN